MALNPNFGGKTLPNPSAIIRYPRPGAGWSTSTLSIETAPVHFIDQMHSLLHSFIALQNQLYLANDSQRNLLSSKVTGGHLPKRLLCAISSLTTSVAGATLSRLSLAKEPFHRRPRVFPNRHKEGASHLHTRRLRPLQQRSQTSNCCSWDAQTPQLSCIPSPAQPSSATAWSPRNLVRKSCTPSVSTEHCWNSCSTRMQQ